MAAHSQCTYATYANVGCLDLLRLWNIVVIIFFSAIQEYLYIRVHSKCLFLNFYLKSLVIRLILLLCNFYNSEPDPILNN